MEASTEYGAVEGGSCVLTRLAISGPPMMVVALWSCSSWVTVSPYPEPPSGSVMSSWGW